MGLHKLDRELHPQVYQSAPPTPTTDINLWVRISIKRTNTHNFAIVTDEIVDMFLHMLWTATAADVNKNNTTTRNNTMKNSNQESPKRTLLAAARNKVQVATHKGKITLKVSLLTPPGQCAMSFSGIPPTYRVSSIKATEWANHFVPPDFDPENKIIQISMNRPKGYEVTTDKVTVTFAKPHYSLSSTKPRGLSQVKKLLTPRSQRVTCSQHLLDCIPSKGKKHTHSPEAKKKRNKRKKENRKKRKWQQDQGPAAKKQKSQL